MRCRLPALTRASLAVLALVAVLSGCGQPDKPTVTLYLAMQRGDIDQLERHIFWGSDIDDMMPNGQFPLHMAAEKGRLVMVRTLLEHGVEIDSRTAQGDSPLELAVLAGRTQVAEELLAQGAELDPSALLLKAATLGVTDRDTVRFLIDRGADTEYRSSSGDTALLIAIRQDNHRLATHLVNRGADVNVANAEGQSALALARELRVQELISLLERQGAR